MVLSATRSELRCGSGGGCLLSAATMGVAITTVLSVPNDTVARQLSDSIADDAYMTTTDPQLQREHEWLLLGGNDHAKT
jgi:hypothetical protein